MFLMEDSFMKSDFILAMLKRNHPAEAGWIFLQEVRTGNGFSVTSGSDLDSFRSIDAFAIHTWRSKNFCRVAYEIKTSRADWLSEIKDCRKRTHAYFLSNKFYFAVAEGVVVPEKDKIRELDGCGVIEVQEDGSLNVLQLAKHRAAWPMPDHFVAALLRKAYRAAPELPIDRNPALFEEMSDGVRLNRL
jgi:hypothetical protein